MERKERAFLSWKRVFYIKMRLIFKNMNNYDLEKRTKEKGVREMFIISRTFFLLLKLTDRVNKYNDNGDRNNPSH